MIELIPYDVLGNGLVVYTYEQVHPPGAIFWRDNQAPKGYGPFQTIAAALTHWTFVVAERKEITKIDPSKVIFMDFVTKKRMEDPRS